ncbi:MAG: hypothetical protein FWC83_02385 [Alphaproteobacteria bacterium]|nr:hypothetical protein [Alphaproteobacteria bacterium]
MARIITPHEFEEATKTLNTLKEKYKYDMPELFDNPENKTEVGDYIWAENIITSFKEQQSAKPQKAPKEKPKPLKVAQQSLTTEFTKSILQENQETLYEFHQLYTNIRKLRNDIKTEQRNYEDEVEFAKRNPSDATGTNRACDRHLRGLIEQSKNATSKYNTLKRTPDVMRARQWYISYLKEQKQL